jgi:hypothetical protein
MTFDRPAGTKKMNCAWLTSYQQNRNPVDLFGGYTKEYYHNYKALEVPTSIKIPNYPDPMGVPVTFLGRLTPQFKVLGILKGSARHAPAELRTQTDYSDFRGYKADGTLLSGKIQLDYVPLIQQNNNKNAYYTDGVTVVQAKFARLIIQKTGQF